MTQLLVFGSMAGVLVLWAAAEWWRDDFAHVRAARIAWTGGAVLMVVHAAAAFALLYEGSHATAVAATARQTAALTGIDSAGGLYVNYAFLAVWVGDAAWWWAAPAGYAARSRILVAGLRTVFLFMFVNGAVVFADGWMQRLGTIAVAVAAAGWLRGSRQARRRHGLR
jgi:hypothetical protein